DAFEVVLDEFLAPQLAAGRGVQREGVRAGRAEHLAVGDGDAVRADAAVVVGLGPADGAGAQVDRVHVGVEVLGVDDASGHHGGGGVAAGPQVGAGLDGDPPGDAEAGDGAGVDRAVHPAGGGLVAVRLAPAGRGGRRGAGGDRRGGGGPAGEQHEERGGRGERGPVVRASHRDPSAPGAGGQVEPAAGGVVEPPLHQHQVADPAEPAGRLDQVEDVDLVDQADVDDDDAPHVVHDEREAVEHEIGRAHV